MLDLGFMNYGQKSWSGVYGWYPLDCYGYWSPVLKILTRPTASFNWLQYCQFFVRKIMNFCSFWGLSHRPDAHLHWWLCLMVATLISQSLGMPSPGWVASSRPQKSVRPCHYRRVIFQCNDFPNWCFFLDFSFWPLGYRTAQRAYRALQWFPQLYQY